MRFGIVWSRYPQWFIAGRDSDEKPLRFQFEWNSSDISKEWPQRRWNIGQGQFIIFLYKYIDSLGDREDSSSFCKSINSIESTHLWFILRSFQVIFDLFNCLVMYCRGAIALIKVKEGEIKRGSKIRSFHGDKEYEVQEVSDHYSSSTVILPSSRWESCV